MTTRTYDDPCGTARALGVIGERWALLVVRELLLGGKRFSDLSRGLPTMSQNVLVQRLRDLEGEGVVRRRRLGPPVSTKVYELTEAGRALEPVLIALGRWGSRLPLDPDSAAELSADALLLALRTTFDADRAGDLHARVDLRLGDDTFRTTVADGAFTARRGETDDPDAVIETDSPTLRALVFGGRSLTDATRAGDATVGGRRAVARAFLRCFPRPTPFHT